MTAHDKSRPMVFSFLETFRSRFLYAKQTAHTLNEKYSQIAVVTSKITAEDCQLLIICKAKAIVFQISELS